MKTALYAATMGLALVAACVAGMASNHGDTGIATGCILVFALLMGTSFKLEAERPMTLTDEQLDDITDQMVDHWDRREEEERQALRAEPPRLKSVA